MEHRNETHDDLLRRIKREYWSRALGVLPEELDRARALGNSNGQDVERVLMDLRRFGRPLRRSRRPAV